MGGSTRLQAEAGIEGYTKEDFVNYLAVTTATGEGGGNRSEIDSALYNEASAIRIAEMAGENIDWLQDLGVEMTVDALTTAAMAAALALSCCGHGRCADRAQCGCAPEHPRR